MFHLFCLAAAISALATIALEWDGRRRKAFYLLKPLTTLLITGIALLAPSGDYRSLIVIGLLLSCVGDICLMFAGNRWFFGGLSSFLLAHLFFVAAYLAGIESMAPPSWTLVFAVYGAAMLGWLLPKTGSLKLPVLIYGLVLMGMAVAAAVRWTQLQTFASQLALAGAVIFVISDSALSTRRFNGEYPGAQALILSTYWLAIGLIAASAVV